MRNEEGKILQYTTMSLYVLYPCVQRITYIYDASEEAIAFVTYCRIKTSKGNKVSFNSRKTNFAPTKYQSIPRLELQAAVFAVRLRNQIVGYHSANIDFVHFWTDSHSVIRWVNSETKKYKQYVANRVGEILESSEATEWRWLPGSMNPADDATRGQRRLNLKVDG